jgi:hypothetical protein
MRARTLPVDLALHAQDAFARAAREVGLELYSGPGTGDAARFDLSVAVPGGDKIRVDVKAMAVPTVAQTRTLTDGAEPGVVPVLIADQISSAVREVLNQAGVAWFDRRGHIRLVSDGVFIDRDVMPQPRYVMPGTPRMPINGRSGLAAASALLRNPERPLGVSEIARIARLNASSITRAMTAIVDAHLAERRGRGEYRALVPELFWALADVWPRESVTIHWAGPPDVEELLSARRDLSKPGWAEAGVRGAIAWNAPLVATADYPRHWYVPDERELRRLTTLHENGNGDAWQLTADPIGLITNERFGNDAMGWFFAHPLFCALDLTASARDREALDQWNPPGGFTRVW